MAFYFWEGQITKLQDFEFTEATDLVASLRLRNYEITRLRADRCLFISGEGQITKLQDYEFTESTDLGASSRLRNYKITS